jgi:hypothetical protein
LPKLEKCWKAIVQYGVVWRGLAVASQQYENGLPILLKFGNPTGCAAKGGI